MEHVNGWCFRGIYKGGLWENDLHVSALQMFIKIYQKVQEIGPVSRFSEFEPRQNLYRSQMTFDKLLGYILSISICMQKFITTLGTTCEKAVFCLMASWFSSLTFTTPTQYEQNKPDGP